MQTPKTIVAIAAASLAILIVFCAGRWTAPGAESHSTGDSFAPIPTHVGGATPSVTTRGEDLHSLEHEEEESPGAEGHGKESFGSEAVRGPEEGSSRPVLDGFFEAARAVGERPDDHHIQQAARAASNDLVVRLTKDPRALDESLRAFRTRTDRAELELLAVTLAQVPDPRVEQVALETARSDSHAARRAGALDILDALDTPDALEVALEILEVETDARVRRAALRAIPEPNGVSGKTAAPVVAMLQNLLSKDPDVEIRRRAAVLLSSWHRSVAEFQPILRALAADESATVRAGCAFACEIARRREGRVISALTRAVRDRTEAPLVRENAFRALSVLSPLPEDAHIAFTSFQKELEEKQEEIR